MKHPYSRDYQPSFPSLPVVLTNTEEGLRTAAQNALVDTGSDGTLVPMALLEDILAPVLSETRIRSHWGEWRAVQLFLVDIELDGLTLPGMLVEAIARFDAKAPSNLAWYGNHVLLGNCGNHGMDYGHGELARQVDVRPASDRARGRVTSMRRF